MKLPKKIVLSTAVSFLLISMTIPVFASSKTISGTCDGYVCHGQVEADYATQYGIGSTDYYGPTSATCYVTTTVRSYTIDGMHWDETTSSKSSTGGTVTTYTHASTVFGMVMNKAKTRSRVVYLSTWDRTTDWALAD